MDEPLEVNFVQQMRDALKKQLSEFEEAKKKEEHDARIVANDGARRWFELKGSLKRLVENIDEDLPEGMLSHSENENGNELTLRHELTERTMQVTFDQASAIVSYQGNSGRGAFRPRVKEGALEYGWENTVPCGVAKPKRAISLDDNEPPIAFSTKQISEIIIRCAVVEPVSDD